MKQRRVIIISGPSGSGKTYLAQQWFARSRRGIIYNSANDESFIPSATILIPSQECPNAFASNQTDTGKMLNMIFSSDEATFRVAYEPQDTAFKKGKYEAPSFDYICRRVYEGHRLDFFVDEAHLYMGSRSYPESFANILFKGRHREINLILISFKVVDTVPSQLRGSISDFIFFPTRDPAELKYVADLCGPEVADKIPSLKRRKDGVALEALHWDNRQSTEKILSTTKGTIRIL